MPQVVVSLAVVDDIKLDSMRLLVSCSQPSLLTSQDRKWKFTKLKSVAEMKRLKGEQ